MYELNILLYLCLMVRNEAILDSDPWAGLGCKDVNSNPRS